MNKKNSYTTAGILTIILLFVISNISAQKLNDNEIKKNVTTIDNSLQKLLQLEPKTFEYNRIKYKDLQLPPGTQYGFMAENLQTVFPELVSYRNYNYAIGKNLFRTATVKQVDVESIIPVLVASIKEQQMEIEKLKSEIALLKDRNATAMTE